MKLVNFNVPVSSDWLTTNQRRLDSGPYLGGAYESRAVLEKLPRNILKELKTLTRGYDHQKDDYKQGIFNGPRFPRTYVENLEYGIPFLGSTDILAADLSRLPLLSKEQVRLEPQLVINQGWTLITCSGTIGRMAYTRADMQGMAGSQHFMRVVPDTNIIPSGYLYAYLSSKYGVPMVVAGTYGAIIQHIEPYHIANLPVPRLGDSVEAEVDRLIREAATLRATSSSRYANATKCLAEKAALHEPQRYEWHDDERHLGFVVNNLQFTVQRALNYDPRVRDITRKIQSGKWSQLGSLCDKEHFGSGIIFKRVDAEGEHAVRLVGQREAFQVRPEGRWISRQSVEGLGLFVPPGTTLIAAHGTLGETELYCRSVYVSERTSQYAFSGDFVRCVPIEEKVPSGYLFAFLRSEMAFRLLRSISIGAKQQAPHPKLLWGLPVPRLSWEDEMSIHLDVEQSAREFDLSLALEDQAISLVEHAIERAIEESL